MLKVFVMWNVEWINLIAGKTVALVFNREYESKLSLKGKMIFMSLISVNLYKVQGIIF